MAKVIVRNKPMTIKAREAIRVFVKLKLEQGGYTLENAIFWTLYAERIQREMLYGWLERHGWRWRSKKRQWLPTAVRMTNG